MENLDRFSLDTVSHYDPEDIEATITREKYQDYVQRFLPHLSDLKNTVTDQNFAVGYADKSQQAAIESLEAGRSLVNARRGRLGLGATNSSISDTLREDAIETTSYNSGLRKAKDLQNKMLTG